MKIGYLQFKPEFGEPEQNISKIESLVSDKEFDLLVMPELANSGYLFSSKQELEKYSETITGGMFCSTLKKICKAKESFVVAGICEKDGNKFYNSAVLVSPDGKIITYRKIQLFYEEKLWFEPGNFPLEAHEISGSFGAVKIGMMVCFDWIFPEVARTLALRRAQIICHPANLVMSYCQDAMITRALENRVFTVTANRIGKDIKEGKELYFTGMSEICGPKANIIYKGSPDKEEVVIVEIDPSEASDKNINPMNNVITDRRDEFYYK